MSSSVSGYRKQEEAIISPLQGKRSRLILVLQLKKNSLNSWQTTSPRYKER